MAIVPFNYDDFAATRVQLVKEIHGRLTDEDRTFLIGFKQGQPDWSLFPVANLQNMPAVQWKLANIEKLRKNRTKHAAQLDALKRALGV